MGKLKVLYKGKWYEYLINTQVIDKQLDNTIENILKYYPKDAIIEFDETPNITTLNTFQQIINSDNESK